MNKIQCDGVDFIFDSSNLPLLIHGENKAGASLFTVTVAANLFAQGEKIIFLSGYPMAREEFFKQVGVNQQVPFFIKDELSQFIEAIKNSPDIKERIIIIKNVELFSEEIFDLVSSFPKIIISGDINQCSFKSEILDMTFNSKVFFSPLENTQLPELEKYQGFLESGSKTGKVSVFQQGESLLGSNLFMKENL